ncbi:MAG: RsmD family RNA methyltransferase [Methanoregula sp.]
MGFRDQLTGHIPDNLLSCLHGHYDVIGSVAVLSVPACLEDYRQVIADALLSHRHSIKTVLNKIASVDGSSRTARYEILSGEETVTTCREYGSEYRLDVLTSFFNPRLGTERNRVTGQVLSGERVLVPFAGVGPFVVPAAARGARVVAIEQNPDAFFWLLENIRKNNAGDRVSAIMGDAFDTSLLPATAFDRVIIPTPYGMDAILPVLEPHVKPGGMVHFYSFQNAGQACNLRDALGQRGYDVVLVRKCGNVAPGIARWVFDLRKRS